MQNFVDKMKMIRFLNLGTVPCNSVKYNPLSIMSTYRLTNGEGYFDFRDPNTWEICKACLRVPLIETHLRHLGLAVRQERGIQKVNSDSDKLCKRALGQSLENVTTFCSFIR